MGLLIRKLIFEGGSTAAMKKRRILGWGEGKFWKNF